MEAHHAADGNNQCVDEHHLNEDNQNLNEENNHLGDDNIGWTGLAKESENEVFYLTLTGILLCMAGSAIFDALLNFY